MTGRRAFAIAAATVAALLYSAKPRDQGGVYDEYFRGLNAALRENGPARPCLVLDLDRLDHNLAVLMRSIRPPKHFRVVAKSLPSIPLIQYISERAGDRSGHVLPSALPERQSRSNYRRRTSCSASRSRSAPPRRSTAELRGGFDPSRQLQWLLDTPERLDQYRQLAETLGQRLRVNIEIDVGLHRGGVADVATLERMLAMIAAHPQRLEFSGFMGYDPHVVKLPSLLRSRDSLFREAVETYQRLHRRRAHPLPAALERAPHAQWSGQPDVPTVREQHPPERPLRRVRRW